MGTEKTIFAVEGQSPASGEWYIPMLGEEGQLAIFDSLSDAETWAASWEEDCANIVGCALKGVRVVEYVRK